MDAGGNFVVGWFSNHSGGTYQIFAQRFDASGQALGGEFRVNSNPAITGSPLFDAAMNAGGEFIFAYGGIDADGQGIEARRYDAQGRPQGSSVVANSAATNQREVAPAVALNDDGTFVVTWNDGSGDVRGQVLNGSGLRVGPEFRVNVVTAGGQFDPFVASHPGGFVVTWTSDGQDGSGLGVYGRRFEIYRGPASVGGRAFVDANNNNVRDASEVGRDGVVVSLLNDRGEVVQSTGTGNGGHYRFDDLRPGATYTVQFTAPPSSGFSAMDQGGNDTSDSDADPATGRTAPFTLAPGQVDLTRDAGLVPLGTISGLKYHDADADGVRDPGEAGLPGWTLFLDADNDGRLDAGERSTVTGPTGAYTFADLRPGTYRLAEVPLLRWDLTTPVTSLTTTLPPGGNRTIEVGNHPTSPATTAAPLGGGRSRPARRGTITPPCAGTTSAPTRRATTRRSVRSSGATRTGPTLSSACTTPPASRAVARSSLIPKPRTSGRTRPLPWAPTAGSSSSGRAARWAAGGGTSSHSVSMPPGRNSAASSG